LSCGIGDLRLTCASTHSRNYSFGQQLAKNPSLADRLSSGDAVLDTTTEGYSTAQALKKSALALPANTPILDQILVLLNIK
jgi:glycerol-3-phosphate dehydrogenase (NAD(P)+)